MVELQNEVVSIVSSLQANPQASPNAVSERSRRGWVVVASAFAIMFVTIGSTYSFSAFFSALQDSFAASRGDISLIFSIATAVNYLIGAVSGPLADRFGARPVCLIGIAVAGSGLLFAATASSLWHVTIGFGLGLGVGCGFCFVPALAAVQRWFVQRRGLASGIAVAGIGLGTFVMPVVAEHLISAVGWRNAWITLGCLILAVGGAAALWIDNSPERHGLLPDGGTIGHGGRHASGTVAGASLRDAVASRPFILLYLSLVPIWIGTSIPFVHFVPHAVDHGVARGTAVAMFGLVGIGSTLGRFLLGSVADRFGRRSLLVCVLAGLALTQLWWMAAAAVWQFAAFALVFGSLYGGFVALYPALTVDYFGGRNASGIIGFLYTGCAVGAFIGPRLAGDVFDMSGSYTMSIAIGAGTTCLAALCVFLAPEPSSFELRRAQSDGSDRIKDAAQ
jgi:MFS family permease